MGLQLENHPWHLHMYFRAEQTSIYMIMDSTCRIRCTQRQTGYMSLATMLNLPVICICTSLLKSLCYLSFRRLKDSPSSVDCSSSMYYLKYRILFLPSPYSSFLSESPDKCLLNFRFLLVLKMCEPTATQVTILMFP